MKQREMFVETVEPVEIQPFYETSLETLFWFSVLETSVHILGGIVSWSAERQNSMFRAYDGASGSQHGRLEAV